MALGVSLSQLSLSLSLFSLIRLSSCVADLHPFSRAKGLFVSSSSRTVASSLNVIDCLEWHESMYQIAHRMKLSYIRVHSIWRTGFVRNGNAGEGITTQPTVRASVNGSMRALHDTMEPWTVLVSKRLQGTPGLCSCWMG